MAMAVLRAQDDINVDSTPQRPVSDEDSDSNNRRSILTKRSGSGPRVGGTRRGSGKALMDARRFAELAAEVGDFRGPPSDPEDLEDFEKATLGLPPGDIPDTVGRGRLDEELMLELAEAAAQNLRPQQSSPMKSQDANPDCERQGSAARSEGTKEEDDDEATEDALSGSPDDGEDGATAASRDALHLKILRGACGSGPPYCPEGWSWKVPANAQHISGHWTDVVYKRDGTDIVVTKRAKLVQYFMAEEGLTQLKSQDRVKAGFPRIRAVDHGSEREVRRQKRGGGKNGETDAGTVHAGIAQGHVAELASAADSGPQGREAHSGSTQSEEGLALSRRSTAESPGGESKRRRLADVSDKTGLSVDAQGVPRGPGAGGEEVCRGDNGKALDLFRSLKQQLGAAAESAFSGVEQSARVNAQGEALRPSDQSTGLEVRQSIPTKQGGRGRGPSGAHQQGKQAKGSGGEVSVLEPDILDFFKDRECWPQATKETLAKYFQCLRLLKTRWPERLEAHKKILAMHKLTEEDIQDWPLELLQVLAVVLSTRVRISQLQRKELTKSILQSDVWFEPGRRSRGGKDGASPGVESGIQVLLSLGAAAPPNVVSSSANMASAKSSSGRRAAKKPPPAVAPIWQKALQAQREGRKFDIKSELQQKAPSSTNEAAAPAKAGSPPREQKNMQGAAPKHDDVQPEDEVLQQNSQSSTMAEDEGASGAEDEADKHPPTCDRGTDASEDAGLCSERTKELRNRRSQAEGMLQQKEALEGLGEAFPEMAKGDETDEEMGSEDTAEAQREAREVDPRMIPLQRDHRKRKSSEPTGHQNRLLPRLPPQGPPSQVVFPKQQQQLPSPWVHPLYNPLVHSPMVPAAQLWITPGANYPLRPAEELRHSFEGAQASTPAEAGSEQTLKKDNLSTPGPLPVQVHEPAQLPRPPCLLRLPPHAVGGFRASSQVLHRFFSSKSHRNQVPLAEGPSVELQVLQMAVRSEEELEELMQKAAAAQSTPAVMSVVTGLGLKSGAVLPAAVGSSVPVSSEPRTLVPSGDSLSNIDTQPMTQDVPDGADLNQCLQGSKAASLALRAPSLKDLPQLQQLQHPKPESRDGAEGVQPVEAASSAESDAKPLVLISPLSAALQVVTSQQPTPQRPQPPQLLQQPQQTQSLQAPHPVHTLQMLPRGRPASGLSFVTHRSVPGVPQPRPPLHGLLTPPVSHSSQPRPPLGHVKAQGPLSSIHPLVAPPVQQPAHSELKSATTRPGTLSTPMPLQPTAPPPGPPVSRPEGPHLSLPGSSLPGGPPTRAGGLGIGDTETKQDLRSLARKGPVARAMELAGRCDLRQVVQPPSREAFPTGGGTEKDAGTPVSEPVYSPNANKGSARDASKIAAVAWELEQRNRRALHAADVQRFDSPQVPVGVTYGDLNSAEMSLDVPVTEAFPSMKLVGKGAEAQDVAEEAWVDSQLEGAMRGIRSLEQDGLLRLEEDLGSLTSDGRELQLALTAVQEAEEVLLRARQRMHEVESRLETESKRHQVLVRLDANIRMAARDCMQELRRHALLDQRLKSAELHTAETNASVYVEVSPVIARRMQLLDSCSASYKRYIEHWENLQRLCRTDIEKELRDSSMDGTEGRDQEDDEGTDSENTAS